MPLNYMAAVVQGYLLFRVLSACTLCYSVDVSPDEDCSPAVELSAFDDVFCEAICEW